MVARPPLPLRFANPRLQDHLAAPNTPPVKYQILNCQGKDILVGRLKIETPTDTGHAFILRRFDTGAVSLTTMFRAAFPNASDNDERIEIQWVRDNYDLSGNNGSTKEPQITRLAGTWVSTEIALELGQTYSLGKLIKAVVEATPDPNGSYRRSGKGAATAPSNHVTGANIPPIHQEPPRQESAPVVASPKPPSASKTLPTPSPTAVLPPSKRRKESSPVPTPQSSKPPSRGSPAPSKIAVATPRRSARTKSPAPRSTATPVALTSIRTPKVTRSSAKKEAVASNSLPTPGGDSDLNTVEEENQLVEDGIAGSKLHEEDVKEQKKLIQDLKAQRDAAKSSIGDDATTVETVEESSTKKREREDEAATLKFEFKEPETEERVIATNRRVGRFNLEPRGKSVAWGVAAFVVGLGAV
ncbi:Bouquet formation protein 4 [Psilocybe cubensis]|uniref:HTH APSES-type domain-containing protein n=2 Tax=Psilocybe cubensis TaxID=181762 RepID=A0A8H7Y2X2_PSICU|nr:Bouquet formation protein 4 [Psilocybe cubensis]KAH9481411.1 Bouquet formation protein 4 [Psilocybe cubensis]